MVHSRLLPAFPMSHATTLRRMLLRYSTPNLKSLWRKSVRCLSSSSLPTTNPFSESLVSGTPNPEALAKVMGPVLVELTVPMSKLVGYFVGQIGVSVEGNTVTVDAQQTIATVNVLAAVCALHFTLAPVLIHLPASYYLLGQGYRSGRLPTF